MNSKLKPSHLAGGVAVVMMLIPIVALTQIDFGRNPGPVIRIKLSDPQPYVPGEAMVSPGSGSVDLGENEMEGEDVPTIEGASVTAGPSNSSVSAVRAEPRPTPRQESSSRSSGGTNGTPISELSRSEPKTANEERETETLPRMVSPVRVTPRPSPSQAARRVDVSPGAAPVSSAQRPTEDVQGEEQVSSEDVSPTEAAREALRDVRPR